MTVSSSARASAPSSSTPRQNSRFAGAPGTACSSHQMIGLVCGTSASAIPLLAAAAVMALSSAVSPLPLSSLIATPRRVGVGDLAQRRKWAPADRTTNWVMAAMSACAWLSTARVLVMRYSSVQPPRSAIQMPSRPLSSP